MFHQGSKDIPKTFQNFSEHARRKDIDIIRRVRSMWFGSAETFEVLREHRGKV